MARLHFSTLNRSQKALLTIAGIGAVTAMVECAFGIVTLLHAPNPVYAAAGMDPVWGRGVEAGMMFVVAAIQCWLAWMSWGAVCDPKRLKLLSTTSAIIAALCVLALLGELTQGAVGLEDIAFIVPIFTCAAAFEAKRHC